MASVLPPPVTRSSPVSSVMAGLLASPAASDDSLSSEASYSYEMHADGQIIRTKKQPGVSPAPLVENGDTDSDHESSPILPSALTRPRAVSATILSRSASSIDQSGQSTPENRVFQRVASQPTQPFHNNNDSSGVQYAGGGATSISQRARLKPVRPGKQSQVLSLDEVPEEVKWKRQQEIDTFEKMSAQFVMEREQRKRRELEEHERRLNAEEDIRRYRSGGEEYDPGNEDPPSPTAEGSTAIYSGGRTSYEERPIGRSASLSRPVQRNGALRPLMAEGSADSYFADPALYGAASSSRLQRPRTAVSTLSRPRLSTKPEEEEEDIPTRPKPRTSGSSEEYQGSDPRFPYNPPPSASMTNGRRRGNSSSVSGGLSAMPYLDRRAALSETEGDLDDRRTRELSSAYRHMAPTRSSPPPRPSSAASMNSQSAPRQIHKVKRVHVDDYKRSAEVHGQHDDYIRESARGDELARLERDRELEWQMHRQQEIERERLSREEQQRYRPTHQRKDSETMRQPANNHVPREESVPRSSPGTSGPNLTLRPGLGSSATARHRRSPTAPEIARTTLEYKENKGPPQRIQPESLPSRPPSDLGHYSAGGFGEDLVNRGDRDYGEPAAMAKLPPRSASAQQRQPPTQQHQQPVTPREQTTTAPPAYTTQNAAPAPAPTDYRSKNNLTVNKKNFTRLNLLGKGGSSKVYRVIGTDQELYALKRVQVDRNDHETMKSYMNEISLLRRLQGHARIIRLVETEVKPGTLLLVMECGEIDLARLLLEKQGQPIQFHWIATYWQQMLEAVHVIHEEKIVHSDLKPANFVLVKGSLKLIDFGIANAIANDTTNIQRDNQIGTVNYMSPEAITVPPTGRLKLGRASDIWSLGCILYQMVYGHPPFHALGMAQKLSSIPNEDHIIEFPMMAVPFIIKKTTNGSQPEKRPELAVRVRDDLVMSMRTCLVRNPKERATIPELLNAKWLTHWQDEPPKPPTPPPPAPRGIILSENELIMDDFFMCQVIEHILSHGYQNPSDMQPGRRSTVALQMTPGIIEELRKVTRQQ